jgi:selenocysteine lyase/cysteine desulfurase
MSSRTSSRDDREVSAAPGATPEPSATRPPAPLAIGDVDRLRQLFPVTRRWVFMNHAALAPLSGPAADRLVAAAREAAADGDRRWPAWHEETGRVRAQAARLLGAAEASSVAFVENTSVALSLIAEGLPWEAGDNVVSAACEYPSNVYPWMNLGRFGVELRLVAEEDGRVPAEAVIARIDERTRVVALSWVQYSSGFRSDLARIGAACRERGVLFVVDAIQGLGALRLDAGSLPVDAVAAATHKWLLGPEGLALLYLGPRAVERMRPTRAGWRSMRHMFDWERFEIEWNEGALAHEPGTLNTFGILALGRSLDLLLELGLEAVERRVLALTDRLVEGLTVAGLAVYSPRGAAERSGIVSVTHPRRHATELALHLETRGIRVADRGGRLRIAPHVYNSEDEVDRVVAELAAC